jgi:hypothetical protein
MRLGPRICAAACLLAGAVLLAGCGSGSDSTEATVAAAENRPAPPKGEFPQADGRSLLELLEAAESTELTLSPQAMVFYRGENRFPFGVLHKDRTTVPDAEVALYFAPVPEVNKDIEKAKAKGAAARATIKAREEPAVGPFPAKIESLETKPAFRAKTTSEDPAAASAVYVAEIDFPKEGEWQIAALIKEGDTMSGTLLPGVTVGTFSRMPKVGEKAPLIHTPTPADVGGDLSKLTTRIPPDTQNQVDYAEALGKEPIVLLFATPQFCQSRVCGPVVDVAEQVKHEDEGKAAFIHMEIFKDNDPAKGPNRQVRAFRLPSEPWMFAIDKDGYIRDAIEGAFGVHALTEALEKVAK